jgi:hypothetical protein
MDELSDMVLVFITVLVVMGTQVFIFMPDAARRKEALGWLNRLFWFTLAMYLVVAIFVVAVSLTFAALLGGAFNG